MKNIVLFCLIGVACVVGEEHYTDKYDGVDVIEILHNERLFAGYFKCLMDRGPCVGDAKELKDRIVEGIETGCAKCTPEQKKKLKIVIKTIREERPEALAELRGKYDPTGTYWKKYEDKLNE